MDVSPVWWKSYFRGLPVELWRAALTPEYTRRECDGLVQLLKLAPGARILDAPCGDGRLSRPLAERGFDVVGVDIAKENIDYAHAVGPGGDFHCGDVLALDYDAEFDAAICMGNSFGYFEDADTSAFVQRVARALVPGGRFVIDAPMLHEQFESKQEPVKDWWEVELERGKCFALSEGRYDVESRSWIEECIYMADGQVQRLSMRQRVWRAGELDSLAREAGFRDVRVCADFEGTSWSPASDVCYVLAER